MLGEQTFLLLPACMGNDSPVARNIVYFDLETQRTAGDVGGWNNKDKMGMSIGVTYSTAKGEYRIFQEHQVDDLVEELLKAELVVGFNVTKFDYGVLRGYSVYELAEVLPTLDMLLDIEEKIGHRLALDTIAQATLGVGKIAEGLDAIRWFREGEFIKIAEYCCFDVKVTKLVHEFGVENGRVFYEDRFGQKKEVEVSWK